MTRPLFSPGARVVTSPRYRKHFPRSRAKAGTVLRWRPIKYQPPGCVLVKFDEYKQPQKLHKHWLRREEALP